MADAGESQASENQASVNLVELFQAGENGIERRRTENLFKQLDERQLTEDEQAIIQQRVELQRKMFQEYERREKQRKIRELQEVCPDLDEEAARRALELCNWKEEGAAERVSSDPAFRRRVVSGTAAAAEHVPAPRPERQRSGGSKAAVGPRPRLVDPSQVGAVFVGRFKGRLGPHQISAMGRQLQQQQQAGVTGAAPRAAATSARRGGTAAGSAAATGSPAAGGSSAAAAGQGGAQEGYSAAAVVAGGASAQAEQQQLLAGAGGGDGVDAAGDVEMADAGRVVEPDSGPTTEGEMTEDGGNDEGGEGSGEGEEDPNSADLSDNELQYEDDVQLPVLSPLAERQRQQRQGEGEADAGQQLGEQRQQQQLEAGVGGSGAAGAELPQAARNMAGTMAAAAAPSGPLAADDEEVSSPARAQQQQRQSVTAAAAAAATTASTVPPAAAAAAVRPRRATAELAAALRHADADSDDARSEDAETASDGGDSDFEVGGDTGGGGAALHGDGDDTTSSGSDLEMEEEEDEDFVAPGSRKRRAGGAAGGKRQQAARKRAASGGGGAGGGGAGRASRSRAVAQRRAAEVPVAPPGAAAIAAATAAAPPPPVEAEAPNAAGPSERVGNEDAAATAGGGAPAAVVAAAGGSGRAGDDDSDATVTEEESPGGRGKRQPKGKKGKGGGGVRGAKASGGSGGGAGGGGGGAGGGGAAISASGHTCRGRVKQKGVKRADLLAVGSLVARPGWFNAGYIFPAGFRAQTLFRSSVDLDSLTLHTCEVVGEGGQHWPAPTFVVTAADRPDEPLVAKSCTGCWTAVLKRINGEIEGRRAAGEDLPPPPKTAIAGPEYFGLNQPEICAAIEALDVERKCSTYWDGKTDREAARGGQPVPSRAGGGGRGASGGSAGGAAATGTGAAAAAARPPRAAPRATSGGGGGGKGRGRGGRRASGADDDEEGPRGGGGEGEEDPEETYAGNRWSAVTRGERYRKRCEDAGEDGAALLEQSKRDNPLPGFLDPITLEPVVNPAISPYGHVMGIATWKAVLAEHGRCPFTKQPLKPEALTVLTKNNIERFRSRIIQQ